MRRLLIATDRTTTTMRMITTPTDPTISARCAGQTATVVVTDATEIVTGTPRADAIYT